VTALGLDEAYKYNNVQSLTLFVGIPESHGFSKATVPVRIVVAGSSQTIDTYSIPVKLSRCVPENFIAQVFKFESGGVNALR